MPSGSPNSNPDPDAIASNAEQKALETFTLDVSAGNRAGSISHSRQRRRKQRRAAPVPSEAKTSATGEHTSATRPRTPQTLTRRDAADPQVSEEAEALDDAPEPTVRRGTPPWLVSLVVHAVLLLLLSFFSLATLQPEEFLLWAGPPSEETIEEFQEIEIDSSLELEEIDAELPTELEDPGTAAFGELSAESALSDLSHSGPMIGSEVSEWGAMFGESGQGLSDLGLGQGGAMTTFFGTKSKARRAVFVIDNTGSMASGGLETVIVELLKSVDALDPRQQFYVLFFSDQVYPLFYPRSQLDFVRATPKSKQSLRNWLDSVELCTGGVWQLTQAMGAAYKLQPDVVYLLCDGRDWDRVRASYKVQAVNNLRTIPNPLGIPVHTLGMGCKSDSDRENLATVAQVNGGTFREVEVTPALAEVARQRDRPYHIRGPGEVWGTKVPIRRSGDQ